MTIIASSSTPRPCRQSITGWDSPPVSTNTAIVESARNTVASPCPTSQKATLHSPGHPGGLGLTRIAPSRRQKAKREGRARRRRGASSTAPAAETTAISSTPIRPGSHSIVEEGRPAPNEATHKIGWAHQPANQPNTTLTGGRNTVHAAANPSTVVGPTNGPAATFASTPTSDTSPLSHVTIGCVAIWADNGMARPSATQRGAQRVNASIHDGPRTTMPRQAATDSQNPGARLNHGSIAIKAITATLRARTERRPFPTPVDASATSPIHAAR